MLEFNHTRECSTTASKPSDWKTYQTLGTGHGDLLNELIVLTNVQLKLAEELGSPMCYQAQF